jgi:HD-GYP domain-containing protein (c-di-GMP phosphodiesterase class II)
MIDARMVENIINASLLHDIGLLKIDPNLLEKRRVEMNVSKDDPFYQHPIDSYKLVKSENQKHEISEDSIQAILNHEEYLDGSGTPRGVQEIDMHILSRIISIANYFELVLSNEFNLRPRHYRDHITRLRLEKTKFDPVLIDAVDMTFKYLFQS